MRADKCYFTPLGEKELYSLPITCMQAAKRTKYKQFYYVKKKASKYETVFEEKQ